MFNENKSLKNEIRILLTAKCNYKCFFCHSEGVDPDANYELKTKEEILESVKRAVALGYDDISFTGGEPLLRKSDLSYIIEKLGKEHCSLPDITIVTNGILLDNAFLKIVSDYPGKIKFNVSLHSFDPITYGKVTGTRNDNFSKVIENIVKIKAFGIKFKLNSVLMKGLNTEERHIKNNIVKSHLLGANAVKFLELLVLPENSDNYSFFFSAEAAERILEKIGFHQESKSIRECMMKCPDHPDIDVEVVKCTCKVGCANCQLVSARFLGPDLNHYPCFIQSDKPVEISEVNDMENAFKKGDAIISQYAKKYKNDSPILIEQEQYLKQRLHAFFFTESDFGTVTDSLKKLGFIHSKTREFSYFYTRPKNPGEKWHRFEKTLNYGFDSHTPNKVEFIYSTHKYSVENGIFCTEQTFLDWLSPPPHCESVQQAEDIIDAIDFETYFQFDYQFHDYKIDDMIISIDRKSKKVNFRVRLQDTKTEMFKLLEKELCLKMIDIPFLEWFLTGMENEKAT